LKEKVGEGRVEEGSRFTGVSFDEIRHFWVRQKTDECDRCELAS